MPKRVLIKSGFLPPRPSDLPEKFAAAAAEVRDLRQRETDARLHMGRLSDSQLMVAAVAEDDRRTASYIRDGRKLPTLTAVADLEQQRAEAAIAADQLKSAYYAASQDLVDMLDSEAGAELSAFAEAQFAATSEELQRFAEALAPLWSRWLRQRKLVGWVRHSLASDAIGGWNDTNLERQDFVGPTGRRVPTASIGEIGAVLLDQIAQTERAMNDRGGPEVRGTTPGFGPA